MHFNQNEKEWYLRKRNYTLCCTNYPHANKITEDIKRQKGLVYEIIKRKQKSWSINVWMQKLAKTSHNFLKDDCLQNVSIWIWHLVVTFFVLPETFQGQSYNIVVRRFCYMFSKLCTFSNNARNDDRNYMLIMITIEHIFTR